MPGVDDIDVGLLCRTGHADLYFWKQTWHHVLAATEPQTACARSSTPCRKPPMSTSDDISSIDTLSSIGYLWRRIVHSMLCQIKMRVEKSKAFRCVLPRMREDQVIRIQRWANAECAMSALFANSSGKVVLVALRDRERNAASFCRTLRATLRRYAIDDKSLRGSWLNLITPAEALQLCSGSGGLEISVAPETRVGKDGHLDETKTVILP